MKIVVHLEVKVRIFFIDFYKINKTWELPLGLPSMGGVKNLLSWRDRGVYLTVDAHL